MGYFDGLQFAVFNSVPGHQGESHHVPIYYGIQYNHSGPLWLRINHGPLYEMEGPCVFLTHPKAFFEYGNRPGQTRSHNYLCCHGPRVQRYLDQGLLAPDDANPLRRVDDPGRFLAQMQKIMALLRGSLPQVPPRAVLLYEELLVSIQELGTPHPAVSTWHSDSFRELIETIRVHPQQPWDFAVQARQRHITPTHFRRLFRTLAGLPPQHYLIQCRLQLAASLLLTTREPVAAVGRTAGITDAYYFSKLFRERFQTTPSKYRREFSLDSRLPDRSPASPRPPAAA